ncbi:MAG: Aspartate aminotransferase [Chlamydiota bacterium]|jgi:aspartate/tyrosine/aromatic aminotransferase
MKDFFANVPEAPLDPVFGRLSMFHSDHRPNKTNLIVGSYRDDKLEAHPLHSIRTAEQELASREISCDYLPIDGHEGFLQHIGELLFGGPLWQNIRDQTYCAQSVGGAGAIRIGAEFLKHEVSERVFISDPTWVNHRPIFERAGCKVAGYPYYNRQYHRFDCQAVIEALRNVPETSTIVFHSHCHNPTGADPSIDEWHQLEDVCHKRRLFPMFDCAYQGFGDDLESDAYAIRYFAAKGHEMAVAYSCSKNFGLYSQRIGALFLLTHTKDARLRVMNQVSRLIRANYSNPPRHGAMLVHHVLGHEALRLEWKQELLVMRHRLHGVRKKLVEALGRDDYAYILKQKGMFSLLEMQVDQVRELIDAFGIYLLDNGRISLAGLNDANIPYVASALLKVLRPT